MKIGISVTIDERMVSYDGTTILKKYEPIKPTKWGFRPYILTDKSCYTYDIILVENLDDHDNYIETEKLVIDLMGKLIKIHLLASNSFYSSEKLCTMPFAFIGSVKINRLSLPKEEKNKRLEKMPLSSIVRIMKSS